ncbi:MAG: hypothetical protein NZ920_01360 [Aigarchaeota archaeon]|nr:hypothetical protein [Aigarchaeota archaeon]MDW8093089.1 hypothetical protein [Nitrososphaerota archaeon]
MSRSLLRYVVLPALLGSALSVTLFTLQNLLFATPDLAEVQGHVASTFMEDDIQQEMGPASTVTGRTYDGYTFIVVATLSLVVALTVYTSTLKALKRPSGH